MIALALGIGTYLFNSFLHTFLGFFGHFRFGSRSWRTFFLSSTGTLARVECMEVPVLKGAGL